MPKKSALSYEKNNNIFAERLTQTMKDRGENQTTLAEKITEQYVTIQRQTISLYMNGQSKPDTERLTAIARVLNVSSDYLLGLTNHRTQDANIRSMCDFVGLRQETLENLHSTVCLKYVHEYLDFLISERELRILNKNIRRSILASIAYNHQSPSNFRGPLMMEEIADMGREEYETWLKSALEKLDAEEARFDRDLEEEKYVYIGFDDAASLFADRASNLLDGTIRSFIDDMSFDRNK